MAVPLNHCFDYEILVEATSDGGLGGSAVSVQEREGTLPGMLGSTPRLRVQGDELCIRALPAQLPAARAWELLFVVLFPLHNRWITRQLQRATVKSVLITVPGLSSALSAGHTLRATLQFDPNSGAGSEPRVDVTLLQTERVLQRWTDLALESEPLG